jgi:hypothetical protein
MSRVIRCLKAGDFCATQTRSLCLTLPLAIRGGVVAKVFHYAIGWGRANASLSASHSQSATPCRKPDFLSLTRMHPISPDQFQKHRNSIADPRFGGRRKRHCCRQTASFLKPEKLTLVAFTFYVVWASRLIGGLRIERRKPLLLACCNRLTVTQTALEGQYFCENFGYRRCRVCRRNCCRPVNGARPTTDCF